MMAGAIVQAAFQTFLNAAADKSRASQASEPFSENESTQIAELRQKIWGRLRLKSRKMQALANIVRKTQQLTLAQRDELVFYLQAEMDFDERFAAEVRQLAERIYQELKEESQPRGHENIHASAQPEWSPTLPSAVLQP